MKKNNSWGVLVMRLQVADLTPAHKHIIDHVDAQHENVVIFLGTTETLCTRINPLDYETRKIMVQQHYPHVTVMPIADIKSDDNVWNERLNSLIAQLAGNTEAVLYGGRDSFLSVYSGPYSTRELPEIPDISGTSHRETIAQSPITTADGRAGIIYASYNKWACGWPTVDIAVLNTERTRILLGKKDGESLWRFIGGFFDPSKDNSHEAAARRELQEEVPSIVLHPDTHPEYIGSAVIDDWRYHNTGDVVVTTLFAFTTESETAVAGDDIRTVEWLDYTTLTEDDIMPLHRHLFRMLQSKIPITENA